MVGWRRYIAISVTLSAITALSACSGSTPTALKFSHVPTAALKVGAKADARISITDPSATIQETGQLPKGVTFRVGTAGSAALVGTPENGAGGQYPIVLTASDAGNRVSRSLVLTVTEAPEFPSLDNSTFVAKTFFKNKTLILTIGYPAATISYSGTLPSGFVFTPSANGTATISASPGMFETPCDSKITITASNVAGYASLPFLVKIDSVACPCNIICSAFANNPVLLGKTIYQGGRFVGQWIYKGTKLVGRTSERDGEAVAVDCEEECGQAAEDDGG